MTLTIHNKFSNIIEFREGGQAIIQMNSTILWCMIYTSFYANRVYRNGNTYERGTP